MKTIREIAIDEIKSEKVNILRVVTPSHTFTRFPFALVLITPKIESYGEDFEYFDERLSAKIRATAKDMGIEFEEKTQYYE